MKPEEILLNVIEDKYKEDKLDQKDTSKIFWKIVEFEANAIGAIGERFVKKLLKSFNVSLKDNNKDKTIHNEYDIWINKPKKILLEVKTARLGKKVKTFQFNGINPNYNYDYLICIGITKEDIYYRIISKNVDFKYIHNKNQRGHWIDIDGKLWKIIEMNPGNSVNYKLTINLKIMKHISLFKEEFFNILDLKENEKKLQNILKKEIK
ncbi:hypothetical protein NPA08_04535 [Mycoplasmopsis citelli]|uniref:hypothetical protein n=1 Tax=Mycoplasmopsis citelli TaxID=171281 RepID=UPI0021144D23|nr:hypothetical protein [Mycoplasmopsis citelli]UUD36188.1 hypothetical protein NPA08_04535 [Mycoplasmopsis citelli]